MLNRILVRVAVVRIEGDSVRGAEVLAGDLWVDAVRLENDHAMLLHMGSPAPQMGNEVLFDRHSVDCMSPLVDICTARGAGY